MPRICVCGLTNLKLKDLNVKQKQSLQGGAYSNSFSHTFRGDPPGRTTNLHEPDRVESPTSGIPENML